MQLEWTAAVEDRVQQFLSKIPKERLEQVYTALNAPGDGRLDQSDEVACAARSNVLASVKFLGISGFLGLVCFAREDFANFLHETLGEALDEAKLGDAADQSLVNDTAVYLIKVRLHNSLRVLLVVAMLRTLNACRAKHRRVSQFSRMTASRSMLRGRKLQFWYGSQAPQPTTHTTCLEVC